MTPKYYILDSEHHPVPVDLHRWSEWFSEANRRVAATDIADDIHISTVFLGIDHRFGDRGPPLLFETLVFGGKMADEMRRYSSWDDAVIGHEAMVRKVRAA